ncbi:MAG TPA: helix-turn-helix transcriptional regulator [Prolixibacteraceae bacterium]
MKDRILKFLETERISPAEFADKIGVQRSSMSHILNGRNQPSAAFLQKMLQAFPAVNSRWLMIGDGEMNIGPDKKNCPLTQENVITGVSSGKESGVNFQLDIQYELPTKSDEKINAEAIVNVAAEEKEIPIGNHALNPTISQVDQPENKEIEQILFFYADKTFRIYRPS